MNTKWQRTYQIDIELSSGDVVTIKPPMTIMFSIIRSQLASAQTGFFTIYNLRESTRRRIFQDRHRTDLRRRITFQGGYRGRADIDQPGSLSIMFSGYLKEAYSQRRGTEWVTEIEAYDDHAILNGYTSVTFPANMKYRDAIVRIVKDLPDIKDPVIGNIEGMSLRGMTLTGNSWDLINRIVGNQGQPFIDCQRPVIKRFNEILNDPVLLINSATGLLDTPKRQEQLLTVKILFEPKIVVGQKIVQVDSIETINNAQYEVQSITHAGVISEAVGGQCTTTLGLWLGDTVFQTIQ